MSRPTHAELMQMVAEFRKDLDAMHAERLAAPEPEPKLGIGGALKSLALGAAGLMVSALVVWALVGRVEYVAERCALGAGECTLAALVVLGIVGEVIDEEGHCTGAGCNW